MILINNNNINSNINNNYNNIEYYYNYYYIIHDYTRYICIILYRLPYIV